MPPQSSEVFVELNADLKEFSKSLGGGDVELYIVPDTMGYKIVSLDQVSYENLKKISDYVGKKFIELSDLGRNIE
tara:strand:+ start:680 stop:904 length:225 start_codon:yes stop_codon:yes gene_type:complete